jgi:hypothetical protein
VATRRHARHFARPKRRFVASRWRPPRGFVDTAFTAGEVLMPSRSTGVAMMMNAGLSTLLTAVGAVAASAFLALTLAEQTSAPHQVVQLERVVVGQRAVVQLPRVVIERRRVDGLALAQAAEQTPQPQ